MLMPAAILVLFLLAAIAVDSSVVFMRQRALAEAAQAAANDAAGAGLDIEAFYDGDRVDLDLGRAEAAARASLAASGIEATAEVRLDDTRSRIIVVLHGPVPSVFGGAFPGGPHTAEVRAEASATLPHR